MTDKELFRQALEALQAVRSTPASKDEIQRAWIVADLLKRGLALPEREPVAWMWKDGTVTNDPDRADGTWTSLYTTPPRREWVGLTGTEFREATDGCEDLEDCWIAIEAKLKEKNT